MVAGGRRDCDEVEVWSWRDRGCGTCMQTTGYAWRCFQNTELLSAIHPLQNPDHVISVWESLIHNVFKALIALPHLWHFQKRKNSCDFFVHNDTHHNDMSTTAMMATMTTHHNHHHLATTPHHSTHRNGDGSNTGSRVQDRYSFFSLYY